MPCSGCARRRKKIVAAYHAVKTGISVAKRSYQLQTNTAKKLPNREIPAGIKVIDIRQ